MSVVGAVSLALLSALAFVAGLGRLLTAIGKLGLPEAELLPFGAAVDWVLAWSYGGVLLGLGIVALRGNRTVSTTSLIVGGVVAIAGGAWLWLKAPSTAGSTASLVGGAVAIAAALLQLLIDVRNRTK